MKRLTTINQEFEFESESRRLQRLCDFWDGLSMYDILHLVLFPASTWKLALVNAVIPRAHSDSMVQGSKGISIVVSKEHGILKAICGCEVSIHILTYTSANFSVGWMRSSEIAYRSTGVSPNKRIPLFRITRLAS